MNYKYIIDNMSMLAIAVLITIMTVFCNLGYVGLIALYVVYRNLVKQQTRGKTE